MVEYLERYLKDERMQMAYLGQGVIGSNASPYDRGTASICFYHFCGRLGDSIGQWGYVKGGIGMVSFILCDIARETEIYLQTVYDSAVAPNGRHTMSVFSQYAPNKFAEGDWDSRREEAGQAVISSIARHCSNFPDVVLDKEKKCWGRLMSKSESASPAATSFRASACPTSCGASGSGIARPCQVCFCAALAPTPAAAWLASTGATRLWKS